MAAIEKTLNFAAVAGKTREERQIIIWAADIWQIIPDSVKSTVTRVDGAVASYRVNCSRPGANGKIEQIGFDIRILASAADAHRMLLRHFLHVSAPLALLQKQWAREQVPYGDVHFGLELWATGNVAVQLTDGREHEQLVRDVFLAVDSTLTSVPDPGKEPLVGVTVRTAPVRDPVGWEIAVETFPPKTQPALSVRGFDAQLVGKGKVLIVPRAGAAKSDVRLVVLRQGEIPAAVRIPIGAQANPASGMPFSYDAKTIGKLRADYRFEAWPGKNLPAKSDLSADQITEAVRSWLKASKRPAEKLTVLPEPGGLDLYLTGHGVLTSRRYGARPFPVSLVIYWAAQSAGAHETLMKTMSMPCARGIDDRAHPPGGEAGNVCYRHQPGVQLGFIRNNMFVRIQMDPDSPILEEDLLTLARALDKAIIANPLLPKPSDEALRWCRAVRLAPTRLRLGEKVHVTAGKVPAGTIWAVAQRGSPFRGRSLVGASGGYVGVARQDGAHDLAAVLLRDGTGEVRAKRELRVNVIDAPEK